MCNKLNILVRMPERHNTELRAKWLKAIQTLYNMNLQTEHNSALCFLHFKPDDFIPYRETYRLKPEAIPNLPIKGSDKM